MSADNDIQELNVAYLMMVKRMLKEDRSSALLRLKLSEPVADCIEQLSITHIAQFANIDQLLFQPSFEGVTALKSVVDTASGRNLGLGTTHAAILMASRRRSPEVVNDGADMAAAS